MIHYINILKKRVCGRNNNVTPPISMEFDIIEEISFQFINSNNQILDIDPNLQGLSLAIGLKQNDFSRNLLALSQDFTIANNVLVFRVNTYTQTWLKNIHRNNTEAFIEISQRDLNNRKVLLRDICLVFPRTFTEGLAPEEINSNNYYTKTETDELLAAITSDLDTHIADEIAHTTEAEKEYWNGKANVEDIPSAVSQLENDANYQNATQVSTAINTAISGKLDNPSGGVAGQVLAKTENGEEWTNIEHPQQVQADWNEDDTESAAYIQNKPDLSVYAEQTYVDEELAKKADVEDVPSAVSQLQNDANYQNETQVSAAITNAISGKVEQTYVDEELAKKQDKITVENKLDYALLSGTPEIPSPEWGSISGELSAQTDLKNALDAKQDALTGGISGQVLTKTEDGVEWTYRFDQNDVNALTLKFENMFAAISGFDTTDRHDYLCFEALEDNSSVSFTQGETHFNNVFFEVSKDKVTWTEFHNTAETTTFNLNAGEILYVRGDNDTITTRNTWEACVIGGSGRLKARGNALSLYSKNLSPKTLDDNQGCALFNSNSAIVECSVNCECLRNTRYFLNFATSLTKLDDGFTFPTIKPPFISSLAFNNTRALYYIGNNVKICIGPESTNTDELSLNKSNITHIGDNFEWFTNVTFSGTWNPALGIKNVFPNVQNEPRNWKVYDHYDGE